jgi:hypothetical protein
MPLFQGCQRPLHPYILCFNLTPPSTGPYARSQHSQAVRQRIRRVSQGVLLSWGGEARLNKGAEG